MQTQTQQQTSSQTVAASPLHTAWRLSGQLACFGVRPGFWTAPPHVWRWEPYSLYTGGRCFPFTSAVSGSGPLALIGRRGKSGSRRSAWSGKAQMKKEAGDTWKGEQGKITSDQVLAKVRDVARRRLYRSPWQPFKGRSPMQLERLWGSQFEGRKNEK